MGAQKGLGVCPMGTSAYGFGVPATTQPLGGAALTGSDGVRQSVRKIDLGTRRYVYDATGRAVGDTAVHQQMQLVATTDLGSCAVLAMGNKMRSLQDITTNFVSKVRSVYTNAYARMVARGLITIFSIDVDVTPTAVAPQGISKVLVRIKYKDLTTGQDQELTL